MIKLAHYGLREIQRMKANEFEEKMRHALRSWIKSLTPEQREKVRHNPDLLERTFQGAVRQAYKEFMTKEPVKTNRK